MATIKFNIKSHEIISTDWNNFIKSCENKNDIHSLRVIELVSNHPCIRLISVNFLFSYYKKLHMAAFPERTVHENSVSALCNVEIVLNELFKLITI